MNVIFSIFTLYKFFFLDRHQIPAYYIPWKFECSFGKMTEKWRENNTHKLYRGNIINLIHWHYLPDRYDISHTSFDIVIVFDKRWKTETFTTFNIYRPIHYIRKYAVILHLVHGLYWQKCLINYIFRNIIALWFTISSL